MEIVRLSAATGMRNGSRFQMAVIRRSRKAKIVAAVAGSGAVLTLGVLGAVSGGSHPAAPKVLSVSEMTMGNTATVQYSETEQTSVAVPGDKASPPCGFESSC
jgi:hypothetical protein